MAEKPAENLPPEEEMDVSSGKPACKKFKLDEYDEVSKTWSYDQPDYRHIAMINSDSANDWMSADYCEQLRLAKRLQSMNLWIPSFLNGSPPSPIHARPVFGRSPKGKANATQRSERVKVTAVEYLISTVTEAMRNGNTRFVFGPLHPRQRHKELLKLPRKSGYTNTYDLEDYLAIQPLCYLPPLPDY